MHEDKTQGQPGIPSRANPTAIERQTAGILRAVRRKLGLKPSQAELDRYLEQRRQAFQIAERAEVMYQHKLEVFKDAWDAPGIKALDRFFDSTVSARHRAEQSVDPWFERHLTPELRHG